MYLLVFLSLLSGFMLTFFTLSDPVYREALVMDKHTKFVR
jgi:hypothetical protein